MGKPNQVRHVALPGSTPPRGYQDASWVENGALVALGGHVAFDQERVLQHPGELLPQLDLTLRNLVRTLEAAGCRPEHLFKLVLYTTNVAPWREQPGEIGAIWRRHLGKSYCAMTLLGVTELMERGAVVEIDGFARRPEGVGEEEG